VTGRILVRLYLMAAALLMLLGYGAAEAVWTNRWHNSRAREQAVAQLGQVPLTVGDWLGEDLKLENWQQEQGEIDGYLFRRYVQERTGEVVTLLIVCGRPGPIALHPPDVCYRGLGYQPDGAPGRAVLAGAGPGRAEFWQALFRKPDDRLQLRWAWSATGDWLAADSPRVQFARSPVLYKLYLARQALNEDRPADDDPGATFLRQLLPQLSQHLFANRPG
jgi:hypothetical protein